MWHLVWVMATEGTTRTADTSNEKSPRCLSSTHQRTDTNRSLTAGRAAPGDIGEPPEGLLFSKVWQTV